MNNKSKKIFFSILTVCSIILSTFSFVSCSKNEEVTTPLNESTIAKRLKFVDVNDRIAEKQNPQNRDANLVIVSWDEWGRASKKCAGWGLCNADWFPELRMAQRSTSTNGGATLLEYDDSLNKHFIDILLSENVPEDIPTDALTLRIDADFELNVQQAVGQNLTFHQGNYTFNSSLGSFGGYRIYLD